MLEGLDQHASGAAGGVIDALAWLGIENLNQELNDLTGGINLPLLGLAGGEVAEDPLVGVPEDVRINIMQLPGAEELDQLVEDLYIFRVGGELDEVGPVHHILQLGVPLSKRFEGGRESGREGVDVLADVVPEELLREVEKVVGRTLGFLTGFFLGETVFKGFLVRLVVLMLPLITDALEEEEDEDELVVYAGADKVGGSLKEALHFLLGDVSGCHSLDNSRKVSRAALEGIEAAAGVLGVKADLEEAILAKFRENSGYLARVVAIFFLKDPDSLLAGKLLRTKGIPECSIAHFQPFWEIFHSGLNIVEAKIYKAYIDSTT